MSIGLENYDRIRSGQLGYYAPKRGLFEVSGKEAVQFLNGLITNDVAALEDGGLMDAAFPNAQGRLLALVRVRRKGAAFLFETEEATREKIYNNLFRFTFAGDFFVADQSESYRFVSIQNRGFRPETKNVIEFETAAGADYFVPTENFPEFERDLIDRSAIEISDELFDVLRIENGIPKYGIDIDETTIVPEIGAVGVISYKKGCYIGQEIIARIHFRGHIAKQLKGLIVESPDGSIISGAELKSTEGRNAGRITSVTFSPKLNKTIALGYVRYDYLAEDTEIRCGDLIAHVTDIPFDI